MRRAPAALSAALSLSLLVAGCGDDADPVSDVDEEPTTTAAPPADPDGADELGSASNDPDGDDGDGGDETTTSATDAGIRTVELRYEGGEVTGPDRIPVEAGEALRLEVTSDVEEEVHVHGFDLEVVLPAGETVGIDLVGDLPGVWEVELHDSGRLLAELEIAG